MFDIACWRIMGLSVPSLCCLLSCVRPFSLRDCAGRSLQLQQIESREKGREKGGGRKKAGEEEGERREKRAAHIKQNKQEKTRLKLQSEIERISVHLYLLPFFSLPLLSLRFPPLVLFFFPFIRVRSFGLPPAFHTPFLLLLPLFLWEIQLVPIRPLFSSLFFGQHVR